MCDLRAHLAEEARLDFEYAPFSTENLLLPLLQFRRREALGVCKRLPPLVFEGHARRARLRNLYEVSEDVVEADAQILYAGARALARFERGNRLLRVAAYGAQLVEFRVEAVANHSALREVHGRVVAQRTRDEFAHIRQLVRVLDNDLEQRRPRVR